MQVRVKVLEVLGWDLPELTLAMCQGLQPETTSVEGFMADLREAVRMQAKEELQVSSGCAVACPPYTYSTGSC